MPLSVGPPHDAIDNAGKRCIAYDVAVNTQVRAFISLQLSIDVLSRSLMTVLMTIRQFFVILFANWRFSTLSKRYCDLST